MPTNSAFPVSKWFPVSQSGLVFVQFLTENSISNFLFHNMYYKKNSFPDKLLSESFSLNAFPPS